MDIVHSAKNAVFGFCDMGGGGGGLWLIGP